MAEYGGWEAIKELGEGGQSQVLLARNPQRVAEMQNCLEDIRSSLDGDDRKKLARSIFTYARPDSNDELGALKVFKISRGLPTEPFAPEDLEDKEERRRIKNEVKALREGRNGLPKLLGSDEGERLDSHRILF
jgi:hypothetical protein